VDRCSACGAEDAELGEGGRCPSCRQELGPHGRQSRLVDVVSLPRLRMAGEAPPALDLSCQPIRVLFDLPYV
jgi:hypothetical protein